MSAFCNEACRRNYRCMYVDYCDLLDELLILSRRDVLEKFGKTGAEPGKSGLADSG